MTQGHLQIIARQLTDQRAQVLALATLRELVGDARDVAEAISKQIAATGRELHERAAQQELPLETKKGRQP